MPEEPFETFEAELLGTVWTMNFLARAKPHLPGGWPVPQRLTHPVEIEETTDA